MNGIMLVQKLQDRVGQCAMTTKWVRHTPQVSKGGISPPDSI